MATQRWYMSWYPGDHTVRKIALQKRQVLCRGYKFVQCVTGCLTSNPNSTKGKILVRQGVDLDTTYIKGGKNPRRGRAPSVSTEPLSATQGESGNHQEIGGATICLRSQ